MRFKKVYIEITNVCNYKCSFCQECRRPSHFMSVEDFSYIVSQIKPYSKYIYLHVLGEPTIHPHFFDILTIANNEGIKVNLTTNGSTISRLSGIMPKGILNQCNVSLHSAPSNLDEKQWSKYLNNVFDFAMDNAEYTYFSLRLWNNSTVSEMNVKDIEFNKFVIDSINVKFGTNLTEKSLQERNIKVSQHIFLQNAARFTWPGQTKLGLSHKKCQGLRDHIAILCDGSVVPCCLDANGDMVLGNIFERPFDEIICTETAVKMKEAFGRGEIVNDICRDCGFLYGIE